MEVIFHYFSSETQNQSSTATIISVIVNMLKVSAVISSFKQAIVDSMPTPIRQLMHMITIVAVPSFLDGAGVGVGLGP
jgi:hypothetical protein